MLFKNAAWSTAALAYRSGTDLLSAFFTARLLGFESYGNIVTLMSLFTLYSSLISGVFTVLVIKPITNKNLVNTNKFILFASANIFSACSIIGIIFFVFLLNIFAPEVQKSGIIKENLGNYTQLSLCLLGILTTLQIYSALNSAMIESIGRLDLAMKCPLLGSTFVLLTLTVFWLSKIPVTIALYLSLLCASATVNLVVLCIVRRVLIPERLTLNCLTHALKRIPELFLFGSVIQFSSCMNIFLDPLNNLILNQFIGGEGVTSYNLVMKVISGLQGLLSAPMRVFLHIRNKDVTMIAHTYIRGIALIAIPALLAHTLGALILYCVTRSWVGFEQGQMMAFYGIATLSNLAIIYITPLYLILVGNNDRLFLFQNQLRLVISNIVASLILIPGCGLIGAAIGFLCATFYNTAAIYFRFRTLVGPIENIQLAFADRQWSCLFATILLAASILLGVTQALNILGCIVMTCALCVMLAKEPVILELAIRITSAMKR